MRPTRVSALVGSALVAGTLVPASSSASVSCQYLNGSRHLLVMTSSESKIVRERDSIVVHDVQAGGPVTCGGGSATVTNTDTMSFSDQGGDYYTTVSLAGGPFAPGHTEETGSNDEIEMAFGDTARPRFTGTAGNENMRFGENGANLNAGVEQTILTPGVDVDATFAGSPVVTADGEGGNDTLRADGGLVVGADFPDKMILWGRGGDDVLTGGSAADEVGFPGVGVPVNAEAGDDTLGGAGGDDSLVPGPGDDQVNGGTGVDGADYFVTPFPGVSVTVDLALTAAQNTGGMGVDTLSAVENVGGTQTGGDTLLGDDAANVLLGYGEDDLLNPGGGIDFASSAAGDDQVEVRDGGPDTAECGPGIDTVAADDVGIDTIAADCENVVHETFVPPPPGGGGNVNGDLDVELDAKKKQDLSSQGGLLVRAGCPSDDCKAILRGSIRLPGGETRSPRAKASQVRLRPVKESLIAGVTERLGLRLTKKGEKNTRAALDRRSSLPAVVKLTATDAEDDRGTATAKVKVVD